MLTAQVEPLSASTVYEQQKLDSMCVVAVRNVRCDNARFCEIMRFCEVVTEERVGAWASASNCDRVHGRALGCDEHLKGVQKCVVKCRGFGGLMPTHCVVCVRGHVRVVRVRMRAYKHLNMCMHGWCDVHCA